MAGEPCCATCDFYRAPADVNRHVAERSGVKPHGYCQRYPQSVAKAPTDWCGEWKQEPEPDEGKP